MKKILIICLLLVQCSAAFARSPRSTGAKAINDAVIGFFDEIKATLSPHVEGDKKTLMEVLQEAGRFVIS